MKVVLVAVAGAAGALSRYVVATAVGVRSFPWSTLAINVVGSLVLGFLLALADERAWSETVVVPIAVGFLGAFTTFSTFSYETMSLARDDRMGAAAVYVVVSVAVGVLAAFAGYTIARRLG